MTTASASTHGPEELGAFLKAPRSDTAESRKSMRRKLRARRGMAASLTSLAPAIMVDGYLRSERRLETRGYLPRGRVRGGAVKPDVDAVVGE